MHDYHVICHVIIDLAREALFMLRTGPYSYQPWPHIDWSVKVLFLTQRPEKVGSCRIHGPHQYKH